MFSYSTVSSDNVHRPQNHNEHETVGVSGTLQQGKYDNSMGWYE